MQFSSTKFKVGGNQKAHALDLTNVYRVHVHVPSECSWLLWSLLLMSAAHLCTLYMYYVLPK